jgi:hypothetical protein
VQVDPPQVRQPNLQEPRQARPVDPSVQAPSFRANPSVPVGAGDGNDSRRSRNRDVGDGMGARPGGGSSVPALPRQGGDVVGADRPGGGSRPATLRGSADPSVPAFRPGGGSGNIGRNPRSGGEGSSPVQWRAPSRVTGRANLPGAGSSPGVGRAGGSSSGGSAGFRPTGSGRRSIPVVFTPRHRPPVVDRSRWRNGDYHYRVSGFHPIPVGVWDPCYYYAGGGWSNSSFYYQYYYGGPWQSGFYYSPFSFYAGYFPAYVYPERVIYIERRIYLRDVVSDDDSYDYYSSQTTSLHDTMDDIKSAWMDGDGGLLLQHINSDIPVRIYQKGVYKYSLEPEDYRDISKDALNRVNTLDFEWTNIDRRSTDEVRVEAKHTFKDPDGDKHIVRLSYTLEKAQGSWWVTETGTESWGSDL